MEAMEGKKGFSSNHLLVNPKQATFIDLISILFSRDIKKRKFIDTSIEQLDFWYRFLILLSSLFQNFLQAISKPMATIGTMLEDMLNLLSSNGGLFGLIKNLMQGKVLIPDRKAATYLSFVGYTDTRMDLDSKIIYGDDKYYPALSIMACKAAYNNAAYTKVIVDDHWEMEHLGFKDYWNDYLGKAETQAFLFRDKTDDHDTFVVSFRGTEPFNANDWCTDVDLSWYEFSSIGKIHSGFLKALGMQKPLGWPKVVVPDIRRKAPLAYYDIRDTLKGLLNKNPNAKFIVTGHSLGGALAILFPAIVFYHDDKLLLERMAGVYTFGQPRVGDEAFANYMEKNLSKNIIQYYRYVYCNDVVPRIPFDGMFKHFGNCVYTDSHYKSEIVDEVPYKNYFSIWAFFPMLKNAIYEVLRSFTIAKKYGPDYKEGWVLFAARLFGLVFPGIPNHCPQDYVNSTRLGSPFDAFLSYQEKTSHEYRLLVV